MAENENHRPVRVLFLRPMENRLQDYLYHYLMEVPGVELVFPEEMDRKFLLAQAPTADIMVGWRPSEDLLEAAQKLRVFINPGAGVQHLLPLFRKVCATRDIVLVNGHGNAYFTAQHAVALLLSLTNRVIVHHQAMLQGKWRTGDDLAASIPLRGKTVGLLGYGAVNSLVHKFLAGFSLSFNVLRRCPEKGTVQENPGVKWYSSWHMEDFLRSTDIVIIAVPLTPKTEGMIGARELEWLGPDGLLVNMARGPVVDQESLYKALNKGAIAGAALDVWYNYRPQADAQGRKFPYSFPFHSLDNVVLSPHRAASPFSDLERWQEVVENIRRFAAGREDFLNQVDLEAGY